MDISTPALRVAGAQQAYPGDTVALLSFGAVGPNAGTLGSVAVQVQDLSSPTGFDPSTDLVSGEVSLFKSADAVFDAGDVEIGSAVVSGGTATIIPTVTETLSSTEQFYFVAAEIAAGVTGGEQFRVGMSAGAISINGASYGASLALSDADRVEVPSFMPDGLFASGLDLDGVDDYVEVADATSLNTYATTNEITLEYWLYPRSLSVVQNQNVMVKRDGSNVGGFNHEILANASGVTASVYFSNTSSWSSVVVPLTANQWVHVAMTYSDATGLRCMKTAFWWIPCPRRELSTAWLCPCGLVQTVQMAATIRTRLSTKCACGAWRGPRPKFSTA